jgi:hypothetical protein
MTPPSIASAELRAEGVSRRNLALLAALFAALVIAPWVVNDYMITVLILILYLAYTGQAWNIMMGFAGQLSLGHALYAGLGAYIAAVLFKQFGIAPWLGFLAALPVAAAAGGIIGFLAFRFGVAGVYFAILTIAFAEFARIGFDHLGVVNASAGLFLPVTQHAHNDLWNLRGGPTMFYYVILTATALAFILCRVLLNSRIGYFWLAIRHVLCVLLQQPVSRAGIQHFPLDRDDPRPDHRRRRHAVRTDPRGVCAHGARRNAQFRDGRLRRRSARRQAGALRYLSPSCRHGVAEWHLAVAVAAA